MAIYGSGAVALNVRGDVCRLTIFSQIINRILDHLSATLLLILVMSL